MKKSSTERLKGGRLKVTPARVAILDLLAEEHGPFTVEELHARVKKAKCDLVTVYRTLPALEKAGLVRRCDFGDGPVRYEYQDEHHHHHHVICRECREVKSLDVCLIETLEETLRKQGFSEITHSLEFFATCAKCARK